MRLKYFKPTKDATVNSILVETEVEFGIHLIARMGLTLQRAMVAQIFVDRLNAQVQPEKQTLVQWQGLWNRLRDAVDQTEEVR